MLPKAAQRERILAALAERGGLTEISAEQVSRDLHVPAADVWGTGSFYSLLRTPGTRVRVCSGLSCRVNGGDALLEAKRRHGEDVEAVSCLGQCDRAPAFLKSDLSLGETCSTLCSVLPDSPDLPINLGGAQDMSFPALALVRTLSPHHVLNEIQNAGLQGRGGAGFPAHIKWRAVAAAKDPVRYVVCNADEGEPGTFKDREVMARQPAKLLEGLAIAAHIVGAREIYIYIRGEFQAEKAKLEEAIAGAAAHLSDFEFHIHEGQGAYICGEETALLESLEGKRGMPRLKPPFPTEHGFRGKPTLIHNVETLACVPAIILRGGAWFKQLGRGEPGTKLYCISGHVARPGVYELPLGVTLDDLVAVAGGYVGTPRAFSPGGASSGFLPMAERARPLSYKALSDVGTMLGSAGVVVLNDSVNVADAARWQTQFFEEESCGQCAPCRIGTHYLRERIDECRQSKSPRALGHLEDVAWEMEEGSICGLGMVAAKPLQMAMKYFPEDFGNG